MVLSGVLCIAGGGWGRGWVALELGVRVYPIFRVGLFGFFVFRVSNIYTQTRTRNFGYP
jgi:hypothetical protein